MQTVAAVTDRPIKLDPRETRREKVRYVDIGLIDGPVSHLADAPTVLSAEAPSRCRQLIATGDTLYSTVRPYLRKVALVSEELNGEFASTGYAVLRPTEGLHPAFLYYFTLSKDFEEQILPLQKGVSYPAVLDREVRAQRVWFPKMSEQRRIVEILEDHLSRLDAADKALQSASRRGAACLTSSMASLSATEQWPIETIGEHALLVEYGTSSKTSADGPGIPVLRMGNIQRGQLDWSVLKFLPKAHLDFPRLILQPGDLLFNRTNSAELVGKAAVYDDPRPASFASYLIRVRFGPTVDARWANLVINSPRGREYIGSVVSQQVGQANVNGTKLRRFPLPIPPLAEQRSRCEAHARLAEDVVRMEGSVAAARKRGEALRRGVLSAAFEGKLTGRHTDSEVIDAAVAEPDGEVT